MKNPFIVALAIAISTVAFAQKKELKTAEKAIKDNNFAEANTALNAVEPMLESLDEKNQDKYNYLKGLALYANGKGSNKDINMALKFFNKSRDSYKEEVKEIKNQIVSKFLEKGNAAYETKKFAEASNYFEKVYNLRKKDTTYLYYAAATAVNVPDYDRALELYQKLKDLNYTGIQEQFYAVNVESKEKELFPNKDLRDISVKSKSHIKPTTEKSESKRGEIVKNVALIYISKGENDKAIQAIKDAKAENPDDINLILSEANIYYKMGDTQKFKEIMETATQMDPKNPELQYNLGVIAAESNQPEQAMKYYEKTLELDPNYINAYINSAALVLSKEAEIVKEMNGLGTSAADDKRYEVLKAQKDELYRKAIPYLQKALDLDTKNTSAATTLMNIYSVLGETDKYKAMKAKVAAIEGAN